MAAQFRIIHPLSCSLRGSSSPTRTSYKQDASAKPFSICLKPSLVQDLRIFNTTMEYVSRMVKGIPMRMLDTLVDRMFEFVDQPYLPSQSNFAPVKEIGDAIEVSKVDGNIPDNFPEGVYMRNGPNPLHGCLKTSLSLLGKASEIWIEGEGMIHALYLERQHGTKSKWRIHYNNRYVQTNTFNMEKKSRKPRFLPAIEGDSLTILASFLVNMLRFGSAHKTLSNTSVFEHSGKYYSIAEVDAPHEIDVSTLGTLGTWDDIMCTWNRPFTSHPKKAPGSGELVIFGVDTQKPYFEVGVISADGKKLIHKVDLKFERIILCHDIGVTQRYNIIIDFPTIIDPNRLVKGGSLIKYEKEKFARIGVMPRYGDCESVKWFHVKPCCAFHFINCYEEGDEVVVMAFIAKDSIIPGPDLGFDKLGWFARGFFNPVNADQNGAEKGFLFSRPYEWRLNMETGYVQERYLTKSPDFAMDFPMVNEKFTGIKNRFGYAQVVDSAASSAAARAKYGGLAKLLLEERDAEEDMKVEYHMFPNNVFCTGSAFVEKPGAEEEDDGWLITFLHNEETNISQVWIIDAKNISAQPISRITLPTRVPYGFHGAFMAKIGSHDYVI